jgi:A/G-specific adenine glycosylase
MWTFPTVELEGQESPLEGARRAARQWAGLAVAAASEWTALRHQVTRYRITLHAVRCARPRGRSVAGEGARVAWKSLEELPGLAMPAAQRRLAQLLAAEAAQVT